MLPSLPGGANVLLGLPSSANMLPGLPGGANMLLGLLYCSSTVYHCFFDSVASFKNSL